MPQKDDKQSKAFNRLLTSTPPTMNKKDKKTKTKSPRHDDSSISDDDSSTDDSDRDDDTASVSSVDSDIYVSGFLDDPQMSQGRHRNVMVGDKVIGPIVSSTIQFVKPSVLKAELNKQFRERFDQWEPPKSQRKYIGAKVIDGVYTLIDPTAVKGDDDVDEIMDSQGNRSGSIGERETIRMPPSLTLSKIRSLKQQALVACIRSKIEISTLALACVYFERLCLDCRVDKSNRRLSFAACLLLAAKVNESNSMIAFDSGAEAETKSSSILNTFVKPSKKSGKIFESLIVFFSHEWSISLKRLYAAEWVVFTSLGFSLTASPSQVAFHFKRLLKVLEWNPRSYLGDEMYRQWQESLIEEACRKERREARREARIKRNERKLIKLQRKLHLQQTEGVSHRRSSVSSDGVSHRRHSMSSSMFDYTEESSGNNNSESPRPVATPAPVRGLLSRLSRAKQQGSVGKELDKLPSTLEKKVALPLKHSFSVPNLSSLDAKGVDIDMIHEGENESGHKDSSEGDGDGLLV